MNDRYGDAEAEARDSGEDAPSLCDFSPSPLRMSSAVELGHEPDGPPDVPEFPDLVSREDENRVAAWVLTSPREARQLFLVVSPSDFVFVVPRAVYGAAQSLAAHGLPFDLDRIEAWLRASSLHPSLTLEEIVSVTNVLAQAPTSPLTGFDLILESARVIRDLAQRRVICAVCASARARAAELTAAELHAFLLDELGAGGVKDRP